jgi:predicted amidohydrolase
MCEVLVDKIGVENYLDFTITLVQMPCEEGNREFNFQHAREMLKQYKSTDAVDFIVFPELFAIGFRHDDYAKMGVGVPGPTSEFLCDIGRELGVYAFGTGIEQSKDKYYNTLLGASPEGKLIGSYRKIHPFQEERDIFDGGTSIVLMECGGIKVGLQICYDVRFPEISRKLALEGAELLIIPAAFPDPRSAHWNTLVRARAIENQVYVAAVNRIGSAFDNKTYFGHSQVIDPWGVLLTRLNSERRVITSKGNTKMIQTVRDQITCYADRSPTGYNKVEWFRE